MMLVNGTTSVTYSVYGNIAFTLIFLSLFHNYTNLIQKKVKLLV